MTVKEIIIKHLEDNGYDGLVSSGCECACKLDDLNPCDESMIDCEAGYLTKCNCDMDCDFHISTKKEEKE